MEARKQFLDKISETNTERYQYFCAFFECMPDDLLRDFQYREINKGERITLAGEPSKMVYMILDGEIKGKDYSRSGSVYSFLDFSKMFILGDFELYMESPEYGLSVFAGSTVKYIRIPKERYFRWIRHNEDALYLRLQNILQVLTGERKKDREYIQMGCKERLVDFLIIYYEKESQRTVRKMIKVALTQVELAEKVGTTVRTIQRVIAVLKDSGLVSLEAGKMVISQEQYSRLKEGQSFFSWD